MDANDPNSDELERLAREITLMIDRVHHEYTKYFAGAEKKAPIKMRLQLDKMADRIKALQRTTTSHGASFRAQGAVSKHMTFTAMWEKKIKDLESTKK